MMNISIHTPAKGVTSIFYNYELGLQISIHTPAKGVTTAAALWRMVQHDFNPHSREGSD